jgi:sugar lactone lactonase YvrE
MQGRRRQIRAALAGAVVAAPLAVVAAVTAPVPASATTSLTIHTVGGGPGNGPGPQVGQQPRGVRVWGNTVYVADSINGVIRAIDRSTGFERALAGTGSFGFSGDGGPAVDAQVNNEQAVGLAMDAAGNLYFSDSNSNRVRRIDTSGIVTTIAGTGATGFSGDGGPATQAALHGPAGLDVDSNGNLYIADWFNSRIRKVDLATGIITTAVGTGAHGFSGDGGPATSAAVNMPTAIAAGPGGELYIADSYNNRIRKVAANGIITTIAGTGRDGYFGDGGPATMAWFSTPYDVDTAADGSLLITDAYNNRIRRIAPDGTINTIAGTGVQGFAGDGLPAIAAALYLPTAAAAAPDGSVFIGDLGNLRVRQVSPTGTITSVAGNGTVGQSGDGGPAVDAQMNGTFNVDVDNAGNVYAVDEGNNTVRKIDTAGVMHTIAGNGQAGYSGDFGPATQAMLHNPYGLAVDRATGVVYVADTVNFRIRKVDPATGTITTVVGTGVSGYAGDGGPGVAALVSGVVGMEVAPDHSLYFSDLNNNRVRRLSPDGTVDTVAGNGLPETSGDGGHALAAGIHGPSGVAVGPDGSLYIAEQLGHRIRRVLPDGTITTVAGIGPPPQPTACYDARLENWSPPANLGDGGPATSAQLSCPTGVAVDAGGDIFIADFMVNRIREVTPDGTITTVAGTGDFGMTGDGGPGTSARIYGPTDLAVDSAAGKVYFADHGNNRARVLEGLVVGPPPPPPPPPAHTVQGHLLNATWFLPFGLTAAEWAAVGKCTADPVTQGVDAWVVNAPGVTSATVVSSSLSEETINVALFDSSCSLVSTGTGPRVATATASPNTASWIYVWATTGADINFTLNWS